MFYSCCKLFLSYFISLHICGPTHGLGAHRSWKVVEFEIQIFQAWKVMENRPNGCRILDPCSLHVFGLHIHYRCLLSDKICFVFCVFRIDSWILLKKMGVKRSCRVMENRFGCSVCTLKDGTRVNTAMQVEIVSKVAWRFMEADGDGGETNSIQTDAQRWSD